MKNSLPKTTVNMKKRVGRGYGSGRGGHTSGRGQKGQKSRTSIGILFEGVKMKKSLIKRLPIKRGRLKMKFGIKPFVISINKVLTVFKKNEIVSEKTLVEKGLVAKKDLLKRGVKILGSSKKSVPNDLKFEVPTSKTLIINRKDDKKIKSKVNK